jgi:hypothetical protein
LKYIAEGNAERWLCMCVYAYIERGREKKREREISRENPLSQVLVLTNLPLLDRLFTVSSELISFEYICIQRNFLKRKEKGRGRMEKTRETRTAQEQSTGSFFFNTGIVLEYLKTYHWATQVRRNMSL